MRFLSVGVVSVTSIQRSYDWGHQKYSSHADHDEEAPDTS